MSSHYQRNLAKSGQLLEAAAEQRRAPRAGHQPCIAILLSTYNGARFLKAQLASIERQSHQNWRLVVSDDGSTDETLSIARHFSRHVFHNVELRQGPRRGPCANFLGLATDPTITGNYFAFCDQDDVWHANKLSRALQWLETIPEGVPAVYGARTRLVCVAGRPIGYSPKFPKAPSFTNALVQSIAGGNTMVFNGAAKQLLEKAGIANAVSHDWWAYQLVSGAGGIVLYDPEPHLDYRQHAANQIGSHTGLRAHWRRFRMMLAGGLAAWNDINFVALSRCRHILTSDSRALLDMYEVMRKDRLHVRLKTFLKSGARRQSLVGNVALLLTIILKKL